MQLGKLVGELRYEKWNLHYSTEALRLAEVPPSVWDAFYRACAARNREICAQYGLTVDEALALVRERTSMKWAFYNLECGW